MALSPIEIAAAIKSALGHIGKAGGPDKIKPGAVRDAIAKKLGITDGSDLLSLLSHVQSAQRAARAGQDADADQGSLVPIANHPLDRSLDPSQPRYGYRVKITVMDPETITSYDHMEIVYSDQPLSPAEAVARGFQQWEQNRYDVGTDPKKDDVGARVNIHGQLITAGRSR